MKLSNEETDRVTAFVNSKWSPNYSCPCCGSKSWTAAPNVFQIMEFVKGGGLVLGGENRVLPVVPFTCLNCGYTLLVNALISGAIVEEKKQAASGAPANKDAASPSEVKKPEEKSGG